MSDYWRINWEGYIMAMNLRGIFGNQIDEPLCLEHKRILDTRENGERYCYKCEAENE